MSSRAVPPRRRWWSLTWWLSLLPTPRRLRAEHEDAERRAEAASDRYSQVADREPHINRLIAAHEADRARNHYGDRIAAALQGGRP